MTYSNIAFMTFDLIISKDFELKGLIGVSYHDDTKTFSLHSLGGLKWCGYHWHILRAIIKDEIIILAHGSCHRDVRLSFSLEDGIDSL